MKHADITWYRKPTYYQDVTARIADTKRGERVALATMEFRPYESGVDELIAQLCAAARRGVDVSLSVDSYSFLVGRYKTPGPLWLTRTIPERLTQPFRAKMDALEELQASGGRYTIINRPSRPFSNPFAGRSHIKFAVVNDYLYVGGCNLTKQQDIDVMVGWQDKSTANQLYTLAQGMHNTAHAGIAMQHEDQHWAVDTDTTLLIDCGIPKQSTIFNHALELIDQAQETVFMTCQYFPNDVTAHHLLQAHKRGVRVSILFNHPSKHELPHNILHQLVVWREHARLPKVLFANQLPKSQQFIHAKVIATEQGAIVGSHNYVNAGVSFGTAEIALLRRDPAFATAAVTAVGQAIDNASPIP